MKKILSCILITLLILVTTVGCDNKTRYDTDLSGENLNGISIGTEYNEKKAEAVFDKLFRIYSDGNKKTYGFFSDKYHVMISVNDKKIVGIYSQWLLNLTGKVATKRGITNESSLNDIIKAYGNHYTRENHYNEMGVEPNYDIIYTDYSKGIQLTFQILKDETSNSDISLTFMNRSFEWEWLVKNEKAQLVGSFPKLSRQAALSIFHGR